MSAACLEQQYVHHDIWLQPVISNGMLSMKYAYSLSTVAIYSEWYMCAASLQQQYVQYEYICSLSIAIACSAWNMPVAYRQQQYV